MPPGEGPGAQFRPDRRRPRAPAPPPVPKPRFAIRPRRLPTALLAAGALAATVAVAAPATALARETILYDLAPALAPVIATAPDAAHLEPAYDNLFQQGNATPVLGPGRLAAKVATGPGSLLTPSVDGLDAATLASVLTQQVQASDAHMVFLDELGPT